jgi:MFS family permease
LGTIAGTILETAFESTLPLLTKETWHWDSVGAGLIFLPMIVPSFISPIVGAIGDRYGPKWPTTFGFFFATPMLICLQFVYEDSLSHKILLCGLLLGVGIGMACFVGLVAAEVTWSVQEDAGHSASIPYAQTYGLYNIALATGCMVGPILGGVVKASLGWEAVGPILSVVTFLAGISQLIWTGGTLKCFEKKDNRGTQQDFPGGIEN